MADDDADAALLREFNERKRQIMEATVRSVCRIEKFHPRPVKIEGGIFLGWLRNLVRDELTLEGGEIDLRMRIDQRIVDFGAQLWRLTTLDAIRAAVVMHVALVIGTEELQKNERLWEALYGQNYETAAEILLLTNWPIRAGTDEHGRRRVLAWTRQLRTGEEAGTATIMRM